MNSFECWLGHSAAMLRVLFAENRASKSSVCGQAELRFSGTSIRGLTRHMSTGFLGTILHRPYDKEAPEPTSHATKYLFCCVLAGVEHVSDNLETWRPDAYRA